MLCPTLLSSFRLCCENANHLHWGQISGRKASCFFTSQLAEPKTHAIDFWFYYSSMSIKFYTGFTMSPIKPGRNRAYCNGSGNLCVCVCVWGAYIAARRRALTVLALSMVSAVVKVLEMITTFAKGSSFQPSDRHQIPQSTSQKTRNYQAPQRASSFAPCFAGGIWGVVSSGHL